MLTTRPPWCALADSASLDTGDNNQPRPPPVFHSPSTSRQGLFLSLLHPRAGLPGRTPGGMGAPTLSPALGAPGWEVSDFDHDLF